ncbi:MAG: hypothetical protein V8Q79_02240 [Christensenellales bacterium]
MTVVNNGTVGYMVGAGAEGKGSSVTVSNNGTAGGMDATGSNGGEVKANNSGVIENWRWHQRKRRRLESRTHQFGRSEPHLRRRAMKAARRA